MRVTLAKGFFLRSYSLWRKGLSGLSLNLQSLKDGYVVREKKCGLLMHASIPAVLLFLWFFFSHLVFLIFLSFFCIFSSLLSYILLSCLPPFLLFMATPFLYHLSLWDLPFLSLKPFLASCGISLRLPAHLLVIQPLPLPRVCWLHHSPFPDKITCLVSYLSLFWFYLNG